MKRAFYLAAIGSVLLLACKDDGEETDATVDASTDVAVDAFIDGRVDTSPADSGPDTASDAAPDMERLDGDAPVDADVGPVGNLARDSTGVWAIWARQNYLNADIAKGGQVVVNWSQIQTDLNTFDWGPLNIRMNRYLERNLPFTVQINASDPKPDWIWSVDGVTRCGCYEASRGDTEQIPSYWTDAYADLQARMIRELGNHLSTYRLTTTGGENRDAKDYVLLVRTAPNSVGTEHTNSRCVDGGATGECQGPCSSAMCAPDDAASDDYLVEQMARYRRLIWDAHGIPVALRANGRELIENDLNNDGVWLFSTGTEADFAPLFRLDQFAIEVMRDSDRTQAYWEPFQNSEDQCMSGCSGRDCGCRYHHPVSWNYWRLLLELHKGVSWVAVYSDDLILGETNDEYRKAFDFVNRYAGTLHQPARAPGAWVALRPGDATVTLPRDAIPGMRIPQGNYSMHMVQLAADDTSTSVLSWQPDNSVSSSGEPGYLPIGGRDQRQGRFARATKTEHDNKFWFRLVDAFRDALPTTPQRCQINVTFLDEGNGGVSVQYGSQREDFPKGGTGRWSTVSTMPFSCSRLRGTRPGPAGSTVGADVVVEHLPSGSDSSTSFHMVEVIVDR